MAVQLKSLVCTILLVMRKVGLWRGEKRDKKHIFAHIAIFCYLYIYAFQLTALVMSKGDTESFFECFSVISFSGMGILKLYSLCRRRELWLRLLDRMSHLEQEQLKFDENSVSETQSDNEHQSAQVNSFKINYTARFKRTSKILLWIYAFTLIIFITSPFIEYAFGVLLGNEAEGYPHILPTWNPIDGVHFSCYVLTVICEAVAAIYCLSIHTVFDTAVIGVMIFICGQFSSLVYDCEQIGGEGMMCGLSKKRDMRAHIRISKCHRIHIQLIRSINELDSLLRNILGFYFFLATLTLCSVAVRLKSEQMGAMQLVSLLQYMCGTLTQLYIFCSYGDAVYNESAISASEGPFGAAIWSLSPKIRRELAILGSGMMRPRRLHAAPFNTLDLPSFIQIVRAAYSYYAVLANSK